MSNSGPAERSDSLEDPADELQDADVAKNLSPVLSLVCTCEVSAAVNRLLIDCSVRSDEALSFLPSYTQEDVKKIIHLLSVFVFFFSVIIVTIFSVCALEKGS